MTEETAKVMLQGLRTDSFRERQSKILKRKQYHVSTEEGTNKSLPDDYNPFHYNGVSAWHPYEMFKIILGLVIVPIKVILIFMLVVLGFIVAKIITIGWDGKFPLAPWRKRGLRFNAVLARIMLGVWGFYYVKRIGKPCKPEEARIICCAPHQSIMDGSYVTYAFNFPGGVSKKENQNIPFIGAIMKPTGMLFVDRSSREAKDNAVDELKIRGNDPNGPQLMIFPTGTCTDPRVLINFKRGAFVAGAPLQPVLLHYHFRFFDPTWSAGGPNRLFMAYRLLCQFYNSLTVEFLPVYHPNEEERADPELFAENVRTLMAKKLGVPTTNHSYEDMFLAKAARKAKIKSNKALPFEFQEMKDLLQIDLKQAKIILRLYTNGHYFDSKTGRTDVKQFSKLLGFPLTRTVYELFDLLDEDDDGSIDFPAFLIGMITLARGGNLLNANTKEEEKDSTKKENESQDETLKFLFQCIDQDNKGKVTEEQVHHFFSRAFKKASSAKQAASELFRRCDQERKGYVDFDSFRTFLIANPAYLYLTADLVHRIAKDDADESSNTDRRLSVLSKKQVKDLNKNKSKDVVIDVDDADKS